MTIRPKALLDTNVVVAALERKHEHHGPSIAMFDRARDGELAIAAHAIAETYSTLTRAGGLFRWLPDEAWQGIASVMKVTTLVGLSPAAQLDAVRIFAEKHGIGPRLYDHLVGQTAVQNGIDTIVTWNIRHMRSLFPKLRVTAPTDVDRP